ncbi:MAG TPA: hypothetical protein VLI90_01810, partial [Tepidisphaeraceae bacterium]|nr:hypothetical protein [Tepidisphaeraceae bacterium]
RVRLGLPWMGANLVLAALAWATAMQPQAGQAVAAGPAGAAKTAAPASMATHRTLRTSVALHIITSALRSSLAY